jgi:hypothetical protein
MSKIIGIAALARSGKDTVASMLLKHNCVTTYALADPLKVGCQALFGLTDAETWDDELKEQEIPLWGWSPRRFFQTVGTDWLRELNPEHWLLRADLALNHNIPIAPNKSKVDFEDPKAPLRLALEAIFGITQDEAWLPALANKKNRFWDMTPNEMLHFIESKLLSTFDNYEALRTQRSITSPTRKILSHNKNDVVIIKDIRFENEAEFLRNHGGTIWHIKREQALKVISHASEKGIKVKDKDIVIQNNGSLEELEFAVQNEWNKFNFG